MLQFLCFGLYGACFCMEGYLLHVSVGGLCVARLCEWLLCCPSCLCVCVGGEALCYIFLYVCGGMCYVSVSVCVRLCYMVLFCGFVCYRLLGVWVCVTGFVCVWVCVTSLFVCRTLCVTPGTCFYVCVLQCLRMVSKAFSHCLGLFVRLSA